MFTFDGTVFANFPLTNIHPYILYMIRADYNDKDRVVNIIANSFAANKNVNYIIKQDKKRQQTAGGSNTGKSIEGKTRLFRNIYCKGYFMVKKSGFTFYKQLDIIYSRFN